MYASDHFEKGVLNVFLGQTLTAPAKLYAALYLSSPGETGTGGTEASYQGYARQEIMFTTPATDAEVGALAIKNTADINFPAPDSDSGTVTYIALFDERAPKSGNLWAYGQARDTLTLGAGHVPRLLAGEVKFYLSGDLAVPMQTNILNVLRGTSIPGVTPYYAIFNGSPDAGGAELSGSNYARQAVSFSTPAEQASGQMLIKNSAPFTFPRAAASWGSWSHSVIYSADSAGYAMVIYQRPQTETIKSGYQVFVESDRVRVYMN